MSTYLSPIVSSGDSTPVEQQVGGGGGGNQSDNHVEYPTRELKIQPAASASEAPARRQVAAGRRQPKSTASVLASQRSIRSMGNSMMLDDSSDSESPVSDEGSDLDEDRNLSQIQRNRLRYMAQSQQQVAASKKVNIFSQQQQAAEQVGGENQCLADKFLVATMQQQQQVHNAATTNMNALSSVGGNNSKPKRHSSSASSSSSLINCSDSENLNMRNNSGGKSHHNHRAGGNHLFGAAAGATHKRFKQILQSIPMVPLVATTSLMTILILLCFVLLLTSDSLPMRATAKLHHATSMGGSNQAVAGDHNLERKLAAESTTGREGPQMQSLVMASGAPPEVDEMSIENFVKQPEGSPARIAELRRELIDDLLAQQRPAFIRAAALRQRAVHRAPLLAMASQRSAKSKRGPERASGESAATGSGGGGDGGSESTGFINSLGSMLFGADTPQQHQTRSVASDEEQELEHEVEETAEEGGAYLDGEPGVGGGARPAHLRSSALELELPASSADSRDYLQAQQQMRARSPVSHAGNKQHATGRHNNNNNNNNLNQNQHVAAGQQRPPSSQQQQQQQQQQSVLGSASGNHERPFDVAQIQCNNTEEGFERFACPTPDLIGRYKCIEDRLFCDGYYDCPGHEDEDQVSCMYYRLFVSHIDILTNTFLTWMKSQNRQANGGGGGGSSNSFQSQQQQHHHHRQTTHMTTNGLDLGSSA